MAGERDEVAIRSERLIDLAVDLPLVDFAVAAPVVIVIDAGSEPGLGAPWPNFTGLDHSERATEIERAERGISEGADLVRRHERTKIDCAAGG